MSLEDPIGKIADRVSNVKILVTAAVAVISCVVAVTAYSISLKNKFDGYETRIVALEKRLIEMSQISLWSNKVEESNSYIATLGATNHPVNCPKDTFATGLLINGSAAGSGTGNVSGVKIVCRPLNVLASR